MLIISKVMTVTLDGESLTIDKLVDVARNKHQVEVTKGAWQRIESCRKMLEKKIEAMKRCMALQLVLVNSQRLH